MYQLNPKQREHAFATLRSPFREYIDRLEHFDLLLESTQEKMDEMTPSARKKMERSLCSQALEEQLKSFEQAQGLEKAWRCFQEKAQKNVAILDSSIEEMDELMEAMEKFLSQLEPTYSAILYRVLDLWEEHLMGPVKPLLIAR